MGRVRWYHHPGSRRKHESVFTPCTSFIVFRKMEDEKSQVKRMKVRRKLNSGWFEILQTCSINRNTLMDRVIRHPSRSVTECHLRNIGSFRRVGRRTGVTMAKANKKERKKRKGIEKCHDRKKRVNCVGTRRVRSERGENPF